MNKLFAFVLVIISFKIFAYGSCPNFTAEYNGEAHNSNFQNDANKNNSDGQTNGSGLPDSIRPVSYVLKILAPLDGSLQFFGFEEMTVHVNKPTNRLSLHDNQLDIKSLEVHQDQKMVPSNYTLWPKNQSLDIRTEQELSANKNYTVRINFTGVMNLDKEGLYISSYTTYNATGQENVIHSRAITDFQSTGARNFFPSFDEPRYRANFTISIARYPNQTASSNMPLLETSSPDPSIGNRVWDTFKTTPAIPSNQVAFCVGDKE